MIEEHKHCVICNKSINVNESVCSKKCQFQWDSYIRKRKIMNYILYGIVAFVIIILLFGG